MEEDIQNYLPTVMFRGTPCIILCALYYFIIKASEFLISKHKMYV